MGESGRGATATGRIDANPADMPHPVRRARGGANRRGLLNLEAQADIGPGAHRPVAEDFGYGIKICEDDDFLDGAEPAGIDGHRDIERVFGIGRSMDNDPVIEQYGRATEQPVAHVRPHGRLQGIGLL